VVFARQAAIVELGQQSLLFVLSAVGELLQAILVDVCDLLSDWPDS
jgi:hypothetical protein